MKKKGRFVSLNYFILPGFTDSYSEFEALCNLLEKQPVDFIQLRNLNMDPEFYLDVLKFPNTEKTMGIRNWHKELKSLFPNLRHGYFNPYLG